MAKRTPTNDPLRHIDRPGVAQITAAPASRKRGQKLKYGVDRREALPAQIAARVSQRTFDRFAALRFALGTGTKEMSNSEVLDRAADVLVKSLNAEQRKRYAFVRPDDDR